MTCGTNIAFPALPTMTCAKMCSFSWGLNETQRDVMRLNQTQQPFLYAEWKGKSSPNVWEGGQIKCFTFKLACWLLLTNSLLNPWVDLARSIQGCLGGWDSPQGDTNGNDTWGSTTDTSPISYCCVSRREWMGRNGIIINHGSMDHSLIPDLKHQ